MEAICEMKNSDFGIKRVDVQERNRIKVKSDEDRPENRKCRSRYWISRDILFQISSDCVKSLMIKDRIKDNGSK